MAKLYKVNEIQERTNISRQGQVQKIYRVTAESSGGTTFSVDIPEADFNKEKVDQILSEKATLVNDIKKL